MANITFSLDIAAQNTIATASPSDARMTEFMDDVISQYPEIDDGGGGTRPMTRTEASQKWLDDLLTGQNAWGKGLKQARLDGEVSDADDLMGNT